MKLAGQKNFYRDDDKPKFSFYWTNNHWRYKDMTKDILSEEYKRIVGILKKLPPMLPTKNIGCICPSN